MPSAKRNKQSTGIQILKSLASDTGIIVIVVLVLFAVYVIDTMAPLGEPVWLLYFIPLILSYWSSRYYAIPTVCVVTLLFLVAGFFFSPPGVAVTQALFNRYAFYLIFISLSAILWMIRRRQIQEERL